MQQNNQQDDQTQNSNQSANPAHGAQGIDKAPGEETPQDEVNFSTEAFKGKKVDADPSQQPDKPASQNL